MQIVPTLNFGGNCREAIHMYEKAFHGKISCLITYGEATPYSSCRVVFVDKFGIRWGIMTEQTER